MNNNAKIIAAFLILGLILGGWYFLGQQQRLPKEHQAIKILIKQAAENSLSLEAIDVYQTNPAKAYKNNRWEKYYQAKIVDQKGQTLYLTQIPKQYLISRFTYPEYEPVGLIEKLNTDIDLFLPIYPTADKLIIQDEQENTLITVSLENLENVN